MTREVSLMFLAFDQQIDLSFLKNRNVVVDIFIKGELSSNGRTTRKNNIAYIRLSGDIPDEYDLRIESLIAAIGGEDVVRRIILNYQASSSAIILGIPCKKSEWDEEGYISSEMLKKVGALGLDIGFSYT